MLNDISQTKITVIKADNCHKINQKKDTINPIVKHTYDKLVKIYGKNNKRQKKYNINYSKGKNRMVSQNVKNFKDNQRQFLSPSLQKNKIKQDRVYSCLQFADNTNKFKTAPQSTKNQSRISHQFIHERSKIIQTALKHTKQLHKSINKFVDDIEKQFKKQQSNHKKIKISNKSFSIVDSLYLLSKPKQRCKKRYCSCKSLQVENQLQDNKKLKKNKLSKYFQHQHDKHRKAQLAGIKLPRFQVKRCQTQGELDDRQTTHKIFDRYKVSRFVSKDQYQSSQQMQINKCTSCMKNRDQTSNYSTGLLGLIKKRQLQQRMSKESDAQIHNDNNRGPMIQNYGKQVTLVKSHQKIFVDQQINTDFEDSHAAKDNFKYLQNRQFIQSDQSRISLNKKKKQPIQHLSRIKKQHQTQLITKKKSKFKDDKFKQEINHQEKGKIVEKQPILDINLVTSQRQEIELNTSISSTISDNQLAQHIAKALSANQPKQEKILFQKLISKQQSPKQKQKVSITNSSNTLFTIPEQQQYLDYLKSYQPANKSFNIKELIKSQNFRIIKHENSLYFGQIEKFSDGDVKNGKALCITPKQIFEGVYSNGIKQSGCQRNIDGFYIGQYLKGKRHGQGKFKWNNGQVYEGQWQSGARTGKGKWTSPKGEYYEGEWVNGRQTGKGIYKSKGSIYEGEFKGSMKQGKGREIFINGDIYEGEYRSNKSQGSGRYIWKDGSSYSGQFMKGLREGYGRWQTDDNIYQGYFKRDYKHGYGNEQGKNGNYKGQFVGGKRIEEEGKDKEE